MMFILEEYNHFPWASGIVSESTTPQSWDEDGRISFLYAHNTNNVLEISMDDKQNCCRAICRNAMGKRGWTSEILTWDDEVNLPLGEISKNFQVEVVKPPPKHTTDNPLYNLAQRIGVKTLIDIEKSSEDFEESVKQCQEELQNHAEKDERFIEEYFAAQPQSLYPDGKNRLVFPLQTIRLQLSQWGFLNVSNLDNWTPLINSPELQNNLKKFDKLPIRESIKIAIIYLAEGQEDARSLLQNNRGSESFNQFMTTMGWVVDHSNHNGYSGGLDADTGRYTIYYCNSQIEISYHVNTMINDTESKRMLLGNDSVSIIWSEHGRDYNPNLLSSQFNDVHIVIYPQPSGMYRVQILRKPKITLFGPLLDDMLVNRECLSTMLRQTAVTANRNVNLRPNKNYVKPVTTRLTTLRGLVDKYKDPLSLGETSAELFTSKKTNEE